MKKEIVIYLVVGLVIGLIAGTQINRCKIDTSGPRTTKVDRITGKTWILSLTGHGEWRELQDK